MLMMTVEENVFGDFGIQRHNDICIVLIAYEEVIIRSELILAEFGSEFSDIRLLSMSMVV